MFHPELASAVAQTRLDDLHRDLRRRALRRPTPDSPAPGSPAPAQRRRTLRSPMARMQRAASAG